MKRSTIIFDFFKKKNVNILEVNTSYATLTNSN